ncbi:MAG TPA: IPT/TIG domain-containing protein [Solirubrobacterales bacterium]|nr:IPT/TIG domain-containing protein [Solirubrobacterales bacterium]
MAREQAVGNARGIDCRGRLTMRRIAIVVCALGALTALGAAGPAAAATVSRPLPADEYGARPLCGAPALGHAACFSIELVPQTAAARARATPLGMTLHHSVEPHSAADGAYGLRPQDLHGAYGLPTAAPAPQTIAIVDAYDDPTAEADLATYDAEFGLPACTHANGCFTKVNQHGSESSLPAYNSGWAGEIALDVEAAHAVCQTNCRILLVEAESSLTSNLEASVETAVAMGATEVSNSYGGPEPATEGAAYDHPGIAIAASTGDDGYLNWSSSLSTYPGHPNYPASSPDVVAVGGTRLTLSGGARSSERVWNDGSTLGTSFGAGGSGCSEHAQAPEWQQEVPDWTGVGCGSSRAAADVSADADPYTGLAVYRNGSWSPIGGTSLASPIIAATYALAGGTGGLDYPARSLYGQLGSADLFDVTEGSNGECAKAFDEADGTAGCTTEEEEEDCAKALICRAAAGFDGPTGVGTPEGLAAFAPPQPVVTGISPDEGDLGTEVTISGEYLGNVASVKFGAASASGIVEVSPTELTVAAPGHAAGQVDVTVTNGGGTSATSGADRFTYVEGTLEEAPVSSSPPTISGTPTKGQTLTEGHGGWENAPTSYAYRWLRCDADGASCIAIPGATEAVYKLTSADVGATIRVEETGSNGAGQASAESAPTAAVADKPRQPFTWTGATARSIGVSADEWSTAGNWEGGSGPSESLDLETATFPSLAGNADCGSSPVDACYQSHNDIGGVEVGGISVDDRLPYIFYGQPLTLGAGGIEALSTGSENNVTVPSFRMPITLGADQSWSVEGTGFAMPGDGGLELEGSLSGESHSLRVDLSEGGGITTVGSPDDEVGPLTFAGADSEKSGWDAGKNGLLGLGLDASEAPRLNATDGNPVRLDHTAVIGVGTVGPLTVSGGLVDVGDPLVEEGTPFGKLNVEGALSLDSDAVVSYDVGSGTTPGDDFPQIAATGDVDLGDAGLSLHGGHLPCASVPVGVEQALITTTGALEGTFGGGPGERFALCPISSETTVMEIGYTAHEAIATSLGKVPYSVSPPTVTGSPATGQVLTAYQGAWWNSPNSNYEYQWKRCDSAGSECSAIPGATQYVYVVGAEDVGHTLRVETTAHNEAGQSSVSSDATSDVALSAPVADQWPAISGSAIVGETLETTEGTWENSPTSYTYQWLRCDPLSGGCVEIAGATTNEYTLAAADVGRRLIAEVTAHNATGSGSATSSPSAVVVASSPAEPEEPEPEPSSPSEPSGPSTPSGSPSPSLSGSTGPPSVAPAPVSPGSGTAVASAKASVRGGKASIELRCKGGGACSGTLLLEPATTAGRHSKRHGVHRKRSTPIGKASFSIPAGGKATVVVHLSAAGSKLLRKAGRKGLVVSLTGVDVTARTVLLEGAVKKHGRHGKR